MQEGEYTFVTLDNDDAQLVDAVVVDVDNDGGDMLDVVFLDDSADSSFITLSDDTIMLSDADMDIHVSDIDGSDISFMI